MQPGAEMGMAVRKDNVDLVFSIGELARLFEKSTSLTDFLQTAVSVVAYHMRAAVCSVYLFEEKTSELVLTANQGLSADSIGRVRLKIGEGLVGKACKELRPIREGRATHHPAFKFIPGIDEERYQAFLAVPILRQLNRIGVLVVQDPVEDYFDDNDTKALQAIAAQLATVVENAKLLLTLDQIQTGNVVDLVSAEGEPELKFLRGQPASGGYARGRATVFGSMDNSAEMPTGPALHTTPEAFRRALAATEQQLEQLQLQMQRDLADVASLIFSAHILMLKDSKFCGTMMSMVEEGLPAPEAVARVVKEYTTRFAASANPRLREKVADIKDLGRRLLRNLRAGPEEDVDYRGHVIICGELLPSDILKLAAQKAEGLVQVSGGLTSHAAILARSLQLPMVIADDRRLFTLPGPTQLLIDGDQGTVFVEPSADVVRNYETLAEARRQAEAHAAVMPEQTCSRDGVRVRIQANINMLSELKVASTLKAEGVGLYRSEFPFIVRNDFPSEEEQTRIYTRIVEAMAGKPVVFRTLDVGGDKMLSYFPSVDEANPFLGLRAIRFSLRNKAIFRQQLRALLRAGVGHPLQIMFPLVSSVDDFLEARAVVMDCIQQLKGENEIHNPNPDLGVMVELPSAVEIADELAAEADFLSIGANDLVQYILAVDRTNEHISDLYVAYHPAVLRSLKRVVDAALKHGKPLSICGEMGADPKMIPFLLGIGLRSFSVEPRQIPVVHRCVAGLDCAEAAALAERVLKMGRISEVAAALEIG